MFLYEFTGMKIGDKCRQTTENALLATINTSKKSSMYSIQHMIVIAYFHYDTQRSNIENLLIETQQKHGCIIDGDFY